MNKNIIMIDLYFYDGGYQVRKDRGCWQSWQPSRNTLQHVTKSASKCPIYPELSNTEFTHLPTLFLFVSLLHPLLVSVWPPILSVAFPPHLSAASILCILSALLLKFAVILHSGQLIAEHLLQGPVWKKCRT